VTTVPVLSRGALRQFAIARTLFTAASAQEAVNRFGFVQADPIRAPARAQDLTLRHRVRDYRAGDLEQQYRSLDVEEDFFINYGFLSREVQALMHPRTGRAWPAAQRRRAEAMLAFVRERGHVHPRDVERQFAHGRVTNYWGGSSRATTHLLDQMHYRGLLRVAGRDSGIRIYAAREPSEAPLSDPDARLDRLIDIAVSLYAPLPAASLSPLVLRLRAGVPQWEPQIRGALKRATPRLARARVDGVDWYWPASETPEGEAPHGVRLLAPFDPIVWDRRRFELFWGWAYRFEAYTPQARRTRGYYALPLLWGDAVIGWANAAVEDGALHVERGFVAGRRPRDRGFGAALDEELERMRGFLGLADEGRAASPRRSRRVRVSRT
jgi:uncharacterized protein YcaQ